MRNYNGVALLFSVVVMFISCSKEEKPNLNRGKKNGYEFVDLGLSVKWATCNIGANKPEEKGIYFAWGETKKKYNYSWENYTHCYLGKYNALTKYCNSAKYGINGFTDSKIVLEKTNDAAYVNWGDCWCMPTEEDIKELINKDNCTWIWYGPDNNEFGGIAGYKVQSKKAGFSDMFIFLPVVGYLDESNCCYGETDGVYWTSSLSSTPCFSYGLTFTEKMIYYTGYLRCHGVVVRPVCPK